MTEWINYHSHNRHLFVPPTEGGRPVTDAERIKALEAKVAELEAALKPSMWVGPTEIDISFSDQGRPISLPASGGRLWRRQPKHTNPR